MGKTLNNCVCSYWSSPSVTVFFCRTKAFSNQFSMNCCNIVMLVLHNGYSDVSFSVNVLKTGSVIKVLENKIEDTTRGTLVMDRADIPSLRRTSVFGRVRRLLDLGMGVFVSLISCIRDLTYVCSICVCFSTSHHLYKTGMWFSFMSFLYVCSCLTLKENTMHFVYIVALD